MATERIAHYEIVAEIGAGGMGVVYEAWDPRLQRKAAIKALPDEVADDPERLARFEREARLLARLASPHIATVFGLEQVGEQRFLAMELIEGESLARKLARGALPVAEALDLARQVAEAIEQAHAAGVVHRDVKPANIMVGADGKAKVLDFGLAKALDADADADAELARTVTQALTKDGRVMGTPLYMSPEQARGEEATAQSDVWSFGCVLYEMLTGERAFRIGAPMGREPDWESLPEALPAGCAHLLRRCLQYDPKDRFHDIADARMLLEDSVPEPRRAAASGDHRGRAAGRHPPARRVDRRMIAGAVAVLAVLAASGLWRMRSSPGEEGTTDPGLASFSKLVFDEADKGRVSVAPDGEFFTYASNARGNWDVFLRRVEGDLPINLTAGSVEDDRQPAFSFDGRWIAFRSERDGGGIFVMGATGEAVRRVTDEGYFPSWSPSGGELVYSTGPTPDQDSYRFDRRCYVVDLDNGESRLLVDGSALNPAWSPNGWRIAYRAEWQRPDGSRQNDLFTIAAQGGEPVAVTDDPHQEWSPTWSSDGKSLLYVSDKGGSRDLWRVRIDEKGGETLGEPERMTSGTSALHVSASGDGSRVLYTVESLARTLLRIPVDPAAGMATGPPISITPTGMLASRPSISADGEWIAFQAEFGRVGSLSIGVVRKDGSELRRVTESTSLDFGAEWSPDGRRIAFYRRDPDLPNQVWLVNADGGHPWRLTDLPGLATCCPSWSPDGSRLSVWNYSIDADPEAYISAARKPWSEEPPEPLESYGGPDERFWPAAWSPDGERLIGGVGDVDFKGDRWEGTWAIYSLATRSYRVLGEPEAISRGFDAHPQWLGDGRRVFFGRVDGSYWTLDTETGEKRELFPSESLGLPRKGGARDSVLSPDGRDLFVSWYYPESTIWMLSFVGDR